jgi:hypothetical protein
LWLWRPLAKYLQDRGVKFKSYTGWDLNPDLITEAKSIWKSDDTVSFDVKNVAAVESRQPVADVGVMLGVLNLNLKSDIDNYKYAQNLITGAFAAVGECLIVDFLSAKTTPEYPKEDFVFYYEPSAILDFALTLSNDVVLKHNYAPIPQKEFMVFIYK